MENYQDYKEFIYYMLDKVKEGHKKSAIKVSHRFLKMYKEYRLSVSVAEHMMLIKILSHDIKDEYIDEVSTAVDIYYLEMVANEKEIRNDSSSQLNFY